MGARGQVKIEQTGVYLYTHWGAGTLEDVVAEAIQSPEGRSRLGDEEYLTRIIFEKMIEGAPEKESGYGIGTEEHEDIEKLVTVNAETGEMVVERK